MDLKRLRDRVDDLFARKSPLSPLGAVVLDAPASTVVTALREQARARGAGFVEVDLGGARAFEGALAAAFVASLAEPGGSGQPQRDELVANLRARPGLMQRYPEQAAAFGAVVSAVEASVALSPTPQVRHALCWLYSLRAPLVVVLHGLESASLDASTLVAGLMTVRDKTRQTLLVAVCPANTWQSLRALMPRAGRDRWDDPG